MSFLSIGKVIMSSLFQKEATLAYPIKPMPKADIVRGHVSIDIESCIYCGMCQRKCPTGALTVAKADKSWEISRFNCIVCNCCVEVCPKKCLYMNKEMTAASESFTKDKFVDARVSADA